mmetsp:Transcript_21115/g.32258  ORF Transcript_21115/g.32258 Transcript_21115/m.32258 type:complete len:82 (+) Transcript_21115:195-440(+)
MARTTTPMTMDPPTTTVEAGTLPTPLQAERSKYAADSVVCASVRRRDDGRFREECRECKYQHLSGNDDCSQDRSCPCCVAS